MQGLLNSSLLDSSLIECTNRRSRLLNNTTDIEMLFANHGFTAGIQRINKISNKM